MAKPTVGAWNRLERFVRFIHGHSLWIPTFPSKMKSDLTSARTVIWHKTKTTMIGTLLARTSGTQAARALSSSEAEFVTNSKEPHWNWHAISGTRHGTKCLTRAPHRLYREQGNREQSRQRCCYEHNTARVDETFKSTSLQGSENKADGTKDVNAQTLAKLMQATSRKRRGGTEH